MKQFNVTLLPALMLGAVPAHAGTPTSVIPPAVDSPWSVRTAVYGWAQALDGDIGVLGRAATVSLDFSDILDNLDVAVMGVMEVGCKRWSVLADVNYAEISDSASHGGIGVTIDQAQFLGNFLLTYQAVNTDTTQFDVFAGARVNWIDIDLGINAPNRPLFRGSGSETWVDPILGARFQTTLANNFFVRALGDVGGFGAASDVTWQAMAGIGYRFQERGAVLLGYRAIGTDYANGGFTYDMVTHGPVLGYEFKF